MNLTTPLAGLLAAAAGFNAGAAPQAAANGVMTFPNVRVAAQASGPQPAAPRRDGMMAYKDPVTGKLVQPTPEQAAAVSGPPRGASPKPAITRPPHGGVSLMLEERHQRYAIARKDADGNIRESCEPDGKLGEHHEK